MAEQRLRFELKDSVATLTLDRPKANGIDLEMGRALMRAAGGEGKVAGVARSLRARAVR